MLGFSLLLAVSTGILSGLTPALQASRCDLVAILKDGGRSSSGRRVQLQSALVTLQVGLSMVLLIGGGLFLRSLQNAYRMDVGFDPEGVVVVSVDLGPRGYGSAEWTSFWRRLRDRVAASPRVQSVSLADRVPFEVNITTTSVAPEGHPDPEGGWPIIDFAVVAAGYFGTMRIELLEGRDFTERDTETSRPVAIVNEVLARRFWPGRSALGQHLVSRAGRPTRSSGSPGRAST